MDNMAHVAMLTVRLDPGLTIEHAASGRSEVLGRPAAQLCGRGLVSLCPPGQPGGQDAAALLQQQFDSLAPGESRRLLWSFVLGSGRERPHELLLSRTRGEPSDRVSVCLVDLAAMQFAKALSAGENELLQMVATGQPLTPVLERLTDLIEAQFDGLFCTVLLLDADGKTVHPGAGPRMPAAYMQALDGLAIGPAAGSCGTAMHDDRTVIVDDIATDPLWAPYKDLILPLGFRACWSEPIHAAGQGVIGSFAMYYREARRPGPDELTALRVASHLAGIAIDQARRDDERRRAAQWLEDEVQRRTAQLQMAQDELVNSRKLAALGQMLAGIAHEMNTPLGNALLAVSTLRAQLGQMSSRLASGTALKRQDLTEFLGQTGSAASLVQDNVDRVMQLINRFRQLTEESQRARRSHFELRAAVLQAWARVRSRVGEQVQLDCAVPEALALDGYAEVLHQVLEQLMENACLHGFAGRSGHIVVSASTQGARLLLEVQDDGAGMPAADVERAFEPFFTTRFGQGGSGLGLFVVHNLVLGLLGGSIRLDSQPGLGTTVRLELPLPEPLPLAA